MEGRANLQERMGIVNVMGKNIKIKMFNTHHTKYVNYKHVNVHILLIKIIYILFSDA